MFSKFWLFGFIRGSKGKKWPKMTKKLSLSHLISQEPYIIWSSFSVHMCKRIIFPGVFLWFFQVVFFRLVIGVKGQKMSQNDKNLCLSHFISQEASVIWLWFLLHICKMMTSPDAFFIFLFFIFYFFYFDFVGC